MAKKTLKLGFAMGGGVSLGTFSGAALSETIKQAVLFGGYEEKENDPTSFKKYDEVVVDVFAGASAGSMSLAIMLRGLAHQTQDEISLAIKRLDADPDNAVRAEWMKIKGSQTSKEKAVIAAEVVLIIQEKIWIDEVNIEKLLGREKGKNYDLTYESGLLRRGALEDVAKKYFEMSEAYASKFANRAILADRVLFASTLCNITGIRYDAREGDRITNPNYSGSEDALSSVSHKETRVFDLNFVGLDIDVIKKEWEEQETWKKLKEQGIENVKHPEIKYPRRWIRYHLDTAEHGTIGDICRAKTWSKIVSTSIACGAFPFAFEPVVLPRYRFEFDEDWPKELKDKRFPFNENVDPGTRQDMEIYPFTYVDGGTFNNEPVREAFRMAAYLDAEEEIEFERIIVFVDPNLGSKPTQFRVPIHQEYSMHKPGPLFDNHDIERNPTLDKLLKHLGSMLTVLTEEVRVNEADKINRTASLFQKREAYYTLLSNLVSCVQIKANHLSEIKSSLEAILANQGKNELFPGGAITLSGELKRIIRSQKHHLPNLDVTDIQIFLDGNLPVNKQVVMLQALYLVFIDTLMNLTGKDKTNKIIAIAPVIRTLNNEVPKPLPGRFLEAFSGFTSRDANVYASELGKYCARQFMRILKMLPETHNIGNVPADVNMTTIINDFRSKLHLFNERIENLFHNAKLLDTLLIDGIVLRNIGKKIKESIADLEMTDDPVLNFQFRMEVKDSNLELHEPKRKDPPLRDIDGHLYLMTELKYFTGRKDNPTIAWEGIHATNNTIVVYYSRRIFKDTKFCTIALPSHDMVALANLLPNPIFKLKQPITEADKGKTLGSECWTFEPGVRALEDTLLMDKKEILG